MKPTPSSRRCPSCLRAWVSKSKCRHCGYEVPDLRRMPSAGDLGWQVDLAAWTRMVFEMGRAAK